MKNCVEQKVVYIVKIKEKLKVLKLVGFKLYSFELKNMNFGILTKLSNLSSKIWQDSKDENHVTGGFSRKNDLTIWKL